MYVDNVLTYTDEQGNSRPVFMGSYGIGPARILGVVTEKYTKEGCLTLPVSVAPFCAHMLVLGEKGTEEAEHLYRALRGHGIDILYDDRDVSAGEKFADHELIGIPIRLVISAKTLETGEVEYIDRVHDKKQMVPLTPEAVAAVLQLSLIHI